MSKAKINKFIMTRGLIQKEILVYMQPNLMVNFSLMNKNANKSVDSNKSDKIIAKSIHLEVIAAINNHLAYFYVHDSKIKRDFDFWLEILMIYKKEEFQ